MEIEMNLNDQVKVKLTKHGKKVLEAYANAALIGIDKEGYCKFSLWELAYIFGKEFYNGQIKPVIEDNKLIIQ